MRANLRLKQEIFNLCGMRVYGNTQKKTRKHTQLCKLTHTRTHTDVELAHCWSKVKWINAKQWKANERGIVANTEHTGAAFAVGCLRVCAVCGVCLFLCSLLSSFPPSLSLLSTITLFPCLQCLPHLATSTQAPEGKQILLQYMLAYSI